MAIIKVDGKLQTTMADGILADASQITYDGNKTIKEKLDNISNIETKMISDISLEDEKILDDGQYEIKNAFNAPDGKDGLLKTVKFKDSNQWLQTWNSGKSYSTRILKYFKDVSNVKIYRINNGVKEEYIPKIRENNVLVLEAENEYEISGYLKGSLCIDKEPRDVAAGSTKIILNNTFIESTVEQAIIYELSVKKLEIVLEGNNFIVSKKDNALSELSSNAAIQSLNNLEICGVGSLAIFTDGYRCHGIKASKILFKDYPQLYIDCGINGHDGIHVGQSILVENGQLNINNANDAIGIGQSEDGYAYFLNGSINAQNIKQDLIDAKSMESNTTGKKKAFYSSMFIIPENSLLSNCSIIDSSYYEAGKIQVLETDGTYREIALENLSVEEGTYKDYLITGYFADKISFSRKSVDIIIKNAYLAGGISYSNSKGTLEIKEDDVDILGEKTSTNNISIIDSITCSKNVKVYGKGIVLANNLAISGKLNTYGDGTKIFNSVECKKFYCGADEDKYDIDGTATKKANGVVYAKSLNALEPSNIYIQQYGDVVFESFTGATTLKRDRTVLASADNAANIDYSTMFTATGKNYFNYEVYKNIPHEFENNSLIPVALKGDWSILKENPDIDLSDYLTKEEYKPSKSFKNINDAESALLNNELVLGEIVSYSTGADASTGLSNSYTIAVVSSKSNGELKLTEIKQSGGYPGDLTFSLDAIQIDGKDVSISEEIECPIGSNISFTASMVSSNYPDALATIKGTVNGREQFSGSMYPSEGRQITWTYNTSNVSPGSYIFKMYGIESTGRFSSERPFVKFLIGGLNITSSLNEDNAIRYGVDLNIPVKLEAADTTTKNFVKLEVNNEIIIENKEVAVGNFELIIPSEKIKTGENTVSIVVSNEKGRVSNILSYALIAAIEGQIYAITDKNEYTCSSGGDFYIGLRIIQLNHINDKFGVKLSIPNAEWEQDYSLNYGRSLIRIIGLKFDLNNVSGSETQNDIILRYTQYAGKFLISSADGTLTKEISITIKCFENNYAIETENEDLLCWFDAAGKTNMSASRDIWADKSGNNINVQFNNFNWNTNGWIDDADGNTALTLNAGAYAMIDFAPFGKYEPGEYNGTKTSGMTISIDFSTKNVLSEDDKVVSCLYETTGTEKKAYYLRDGFGEYVKSDANTEKANQNIQNYFKSVGGYCWVDGLTYSGDGTTSYDTTMIMSERTVNYNNAETDKNENYNNDHDEKTYNPEKPIDYKKYSGYKADNVIKQTGFYIDSAYGVISTAHHPANKEEKFHVNFSEDTRTRIDFVINKEVQNGTSTVYGFNSFICYVNGVLSEMETITSDDKFVINMADGNYKIYLGAKVTPQDNYMPDKVEDTGDCKIYSFRIYNKALTPDQILKNYAAEIPDETEKKNFIDNNGIKTGTLPQTLPEICLYGYKDDYAFTTSSINSFIMQAAKVTESMVADLKAVKLPAYISYTVPNDNTKSWLDGKEIPIRLQFQGTSSMVYPCKNYKFKLYNPTNAISGEYDLNAGYTVDQTGKVKYGKKMKVDIGNGTAENTFCLKADYMDSSHVDNTGSANFIADANQLSGKTPAQKIRSNIRTTVYGYPVLLYYAETPEQKNVKHFLGVYNLNLDKSDTDSFGWDKKITDAENVEYKFSKAYFIDDTAFSDMNAQLQWTKTDETVELYDEDAMAYKTYNILKYKNKPVAAISEKGYLRTLNNDSISNVECFEVKANSNGNSPGGFGSFDINQMFTGFEIRYPDQGDLEDEEYTFYKTPKGTLFNPETSYNKNINEGLSEPVSFMEFSSPYYYHLQRMIRWLMNSNEKEFLANYEKHFNKNFLIDYYLTFMLLGAVDSLGKNLMIGTWGPENHLYKTTADADDDYKFEYPVGSGNYITPTIVKTDKNGKPAYQFAEDENGKNLFYSEELRIKIQHGENVVLTAENAGITTVPGECIWYPTYYDIDTIAGLDNAGVLCYDVDIEVGQRTAEGNAVYNTADSQLWSRVRDYLGKTDSNGESELSKRWDDLASKFNVGNLIGGSDLNKTRGDVGFFYNRQIATIPAKYYNDDCFIKYIWEGPFAPGEKIGITENIATIGSGAYLYCVHGSRYEHMKRWFTQRIYFLNSLYGKLGRDSASIRLQNTYFDPGYDANIMDYYAEPSKLVAEHPKTDNPEIPYYTYENGILRYNVDSTGTIQEVRPVGITFKTYQPAYVGIRWMNGTPIQYKKVPRNGSITITGNTKTDSNQEILIYGGSNIQDIGDLSPYGIHELNIESMTKLTRLILGSLSVGGTSMSKNELDISSDYLSELNVQGYSGLSTINVSHCKNLRSIYMDRSSVTKVELPENSALSYISYGENISVISLKNMPNLKTVITGFLGNLNELTVKNCPIIQGSRNKMNSTIWSILQKIEGNKALNKIDVEAYGEAQPTLSGFFFPDQFASSIYTAINIRGYIEYKGTNIPKNYAKFADTYKELEIKYPNVTDASNMFANYNNLKCVQSRNAYAGQDDYGNSKYSTIKYWDTSETCTEESRAKWFNQTAYDTYGKSETFNQNIGFYQDSNSKVVYRLLKTYDTADLDVLRAEIKETLSNFTKFTNVSGMFRNIDVLDYLDPETFSRIDLSEADTTEMFSGCTNLKYFIMPDDIVKNVKVKYYKNAEGLRKTEKEYNELLEEEKESFSIIEYKYYNPFDINKIETDNETSIYAKGIRNINEKMFYQCKKAKILIKKLKTAKAAPFIETPTPDRIQINSTAFSYVCYNPQPDATQASKITLERPVILFEHSKSEICMTTTEATSIVDSVEITNEPVDGVENLYYALSTSGEAQINVSNNYINFKNNNFNWLRECYFNVKEIVMSETISVEKNQTTTETSTISYGKTADNKKILFSVESVENNSFNFKNKLNIISETVGAIDISNNGVFNSGFTVYMVIPKYDCFDTELPRFEIEKVAYPIFVNSKNNNIFSISDINKGLDVKDNGSGASIYIYSNNGIIPKKFFYNFKNMEKFYINYDITFIGEAAFSETDAKVIDFTLDTYSGQPADHNSNKLLTIESYAFQNSKNLGSFNIPKNIKFLGENVFYGCENLVSIDWADYREYSEEKPLITEIPNGTFNGCVKLNSFTFTDSNGIEQINKLPSWITKIGNEAFRNCQKLPLFKHENYSIFDECTALESIGDRAFYNNNSFKVPYGQIYTEPNILRFKKSIKYIGSSAFALQAISSSTESPKLTVIQWGEDNEQTISSFDSNFVDLTIGADAFRNLYLTTKEEFDESIAEGKTINDIQSNVFLPKISNIGMNCFRAFNSSSSQYSFKYILTRNNEENIGKSFAPGIKIIYNYYKKISEIDGKIKNTYLLTSKTSIEGGTYSGDAYLFSSNAFVSFIVPNFVEFEGSKYALTQIMNNALIGNDGARISGLIFKYNSNLKLLGAGNITSSLNTIQCYSTENDEDPINNIIPENLEILSGNDLKNSSWFNSRIDDNAFAEGSFITLGKYIIGYKNTVSEGSGDNTYSLNLTIPALEKCSVIYDEAFKETNKTLYLTSVEFPTNREISIFKSAFENCRKLKELTLNNNIVYIGSRAFFGCSLKNIFIPSSVKELGDSAFTYSDANIFSTIESLDIAEGTNFGSTTPLSLTNEIWTRDYESGFNISFRTLHLPNSMSHILRNIIPISPTQKFASQLTNIYLGELENNLDTPSLNYPLFKNTITGNILIKDPGYVAGENEEPFLTVEGKQLYVPKFYHDACVYSKGYLSDASVTTTEERSPCPVGYRNDKKGFELSGDLDLSNIKQYTDSAIKDSNNQILSAEEIDTIRNSVKNSFSVEDLLKIIAGLKPQQITKCRIILSNSAARLSDVHYDIFRTRLGINFELVYKTT